MPELPEVETVKNGLVPTLVGKTIVDVVINRPNLRYPFPDSFDDTLRDQSIITIERRAKFLIFDLGGFGFLGHLGMSGSYRIADIAEPHGKHDHFALIFDDIQLIYNDPRRFGAVDLWSDDANAHAWLVKIGDEPLGNVINAEGLWHKTRNSNSPIKTIILNQANIAGIGNIYASEALWRAKIHPERSGKTLDLADWERLLGAIRAVLREAIASGGSTLRDFKGADGALGYFQHRFDVYNKAGEACANQCGDHITRITQSGRSTFFCPSCQSVQMR